MRILWLAAVLAPLVFTAIARAQTSEFAPPPPPTSLPPHWAIEFSAAPVFPLRRRPLCPAGADCIYSGGGEVGAAFHWRFARGLAVGVSYHVGFLDGNGVYEITTQQFLAADVRYYGLRESVVHPFVGAAAGFLLLGDSFRDNAVGAGAEVIAGIEVELTSTLAFSTRLGARGFAVGPFESSADSVRRADSFGINGSLQLTFGLVLAERP